MSSVDQRIVILTFDNKNFETNAKNSIDTLDKLKKGLDLEKSAKGLNAISESSKKFSLSGIGDAIESIKYRFSTLGVVGATVISELTKTAMSVGHKIISAVAGPLTAGGWRRALNIEQAQFQLEGLGVAWKDIEADINYGVKDTAYGLDVAARAASQLVASGVQLGDEMKAALRGISGVASMTASSFEDISPIFTTVAGQGKLMTMQLRQLEIRGLNAAAVLAKELNKTEAEVRDMVTKGEIDFATFSRAMDNAFGQHAKDANKTFTGALSNVKAALSRIGADVAATQLVNLRDIFNALIPLIDNIRKALGPLIEKFNKFTTNATAGTVKFINLLNSKTPQAKKNAYEVGTAIEEMSKKGIDTVPKLAEAFEVTEDEINDMVKGGRISLDKFSSVMEERLGGDAINILNGFKEKLKETEGDISNTAKNAGESIFGNIINVFKNIGSGIASVAKAISSAFKEVFSGAFTSDAKRLSGNLKDLSENFKASEDGANGLKIVFKGLFTALKVVVKGLGWIGTGFIKFIDIIAKVIKKVVEFTGKLGKSFEESGRKAKLMEALGAVISKIGEILVAFKDKMVEVGKAIKNSEGFQKLAEALKLLGSVIKEFFAKIFDKFVEKMKAFGKLNPDFSWTDKLVSGLSFVMGKLADFIIAMINGEHPIRQFFGSISDTDKPLGKFVGFLGKIKDAIVNFFKGGFGGTVEKGGSLLDGIKNFLVGGFEKLKEADIIGNIIKVFKGIAEKLKDVDWKFVLNKAYEIAKIILAFRYVNSLIKLNKKLASSGGLLGINLNLPEFARQLTKRDFSQKIRDLGIGLALLSGTLLILSKIPADELKKSVIALGAVLAELVIVFLVVEKLGNGGNSFAKFAASMTLFSIGMLALAGAMKIFSVMKPETIIKGGGTIVALATLLSIAARIAGRSSFGTFVGMALAVGIIMPSLLILGKAKWSTIIKGSTAIGIVLTELTLASRFAGTSSFGTFAGMALAIGIIVPSMLILGKVKWSTIIKGATAIGLVLTELVIASKFAKDGSTFKSLLSIALTIGSVAIALGILSTIDTASLLASAVSLGGVLLAVGASLKIANEINNAGGVVAMLAILAGITAAFYILKDVPYENTLGAAAGIGIVALSLSASLLILEKGNVGFKNTIGAVISLTALLYSIVGAFHLMKDIPIESTKAISEGLSVAVLALSGALTLLSKIPVAGAIQGTIGFDIFLVNLTGILVALGALTKIPGFEELIDAGAGVFGKIGRGLGLFVGSIIGGLGEGITNSMPKIADNLTSFAEKIKPFLELKVNNKSIDSVNSLVGVIVAMSGATFMDGLSRIFSFGKDPYERVGESLVLFAEQINKFAAKMVSGNINNAVLTSSILAANLVVNFYQKVQAVVSGGIIGLLTGNPLAKLMDELLNFAPKIVEYSNYMAAAPLNQTAIASSMAAATILVDFYGKVANVVSAGLSSLWEGSPLQKFGEELVKFAPNIVKYSAIVSTGSINPAAVATSTLTGQILVDFYNKVKDVVKAGLESLWSGSPLQKFGEELVKFAPSIVQYSTIVSSGSINPASVLKSTLTGQILVDFYNKVKDVVKAGLESLWSGSPLQKFGEELVKFAPSIVKYSTIVSTGSINPVAVANSTLTGQILVDFYNKVKDVVKAGLSSLWEGSPLQKFGEELAAFAPSIVKYSTIVAGTINPASVSSSIAAATILAEFYEKIKGFINGGIVGFFEGNPLKKFGEELANFAPYLVTYSNHMQSVQPKKIISVTAAIDDVATQATTIYNIKYTYSSLKDFGDSLSYFGGKLKQYNTDVSNFNNGKVHSVITTVYELIKVAERMAVVKTAAVNSFGDSLVNIGKKGINEFIRAFDDATNRAYRAGENLVRNASNGASSGTSYYTWYNLGYNGGIGLINGLDSLYYYCWNAGYRIAEAAYRGAQAALDSHSPSRKFEQLGIFGDQGLINGLLKLAPKVYGVGEEVGDTILSAVANPLSKLKDLIDDKVDINPVITPVLDLSNVNSNVNRLSGMFSNQSMALNGTYGLRSVGNLNSIMDLAANMASSNMGANGDVVNAIHEMRNDILGLGDAISKMQVRLDGQALVGEIVEPMDYALGQRAEYAGRGI